MRLRKNDAKLFFVNGECGVLKNRYGQGFGAGLALNPFSNLGGCIGHGIPVLPGMTGVTL